MTKKTEKTESEKTTTTATPKKGKVKTKPAKGQQLKLPAEGMTRKPIKEIDDAAEAYRLERNKRQEQSKKEKAKKTELMAVARKHGVQAYVYESEDGEEFTVEYSSATKENVKVTKIADGDEDEE